MAVMSVVTKVGRELLFKRLFSYPPPTKVFNYIGVGSSDNPPSEDDTHLYAEFKRVEASTEFYPDGVGIVASFTADSDYVIRESGIFDEPDIDTGNLFARAVIDPPIYIHNGDDVTIRWYLRLI